ncbi:MAG: hypothetical protein IPH05_13460 [Flavobacteriales bacterium]|nr:hypothetical protein [Flavobacteriales bacterium]MBK7100312.1 hypothetical protein [Flavobacteriales bacterium]MBK7111006.1 hypothetical protein [Flavobacteriales bacterium]MBK7481254.1 hypothetical protein [Flavobacteriales bacterium]MBK7617856.1 hypothetical protein [Flavobacteriales bacterium]
MRRMLLIIVALQIGLVVNASHRDSTERKAAFKVILNFDARRTFVNDASVRFNGLRIGAQRGKDIIALGFYGLGEPYIQPAKDLGVLGVREFRTRFSYTSLAYERVLVNARRWQIGVPVSIGLGNYRTSYLADNGSEIAYGVNELVPLEATLHVDYNVFWFVFIGVGGGYRYVLAADPAATSTLSDRTYYYKIGLRFGEVVKRVRKRLRNGQGT